jgi:pilus assembly protein CpaB
MAKWKPIIPIVLALVIALGGSAFLYKWLRAQTLPKEVVKVEAEAVPVVVAKADLTWGTKLKKEMMKTTPYLKESLPGEIFSEPEALEGRILVSALKQNEPLTKSKLAPEDVTVGGVSAVLKPGKRAIAVKGDKVIGISGLIQPGNIVDVLVTLTDPRSKMEVTKLVLEKIPVLATGTEIQQNGKGEPAPVDVYTLEVTPEEGEKLSLAATRGKLQFALRNITDTETVLTVGATIPKTLASLRGVDPKAKQGKGSKKKVWRPRRRSVTVEVIKGDKVSKKKFRLN